MAKQQPQPDAAPEPPARQGMPDIPPPPNPSVYAQPPSAHAPGHDDPAAPTNVLAVLSLVGSLLGLLMILPVVGSILGVSFGHVGRKQIREKGERGDGIALAGLVIGYVGLVLGLLVVVAFIAFVVMLDQATRNS